MALAIALDAHDHECSQHFAQELARVRTRYPALWERAKQRLLYEVVAKDLLPEDQRDTLTIQLDRRGDEHFRQWVDDELYHGKRAGIIPREWGVSALIKAIVRGQYRPLQQPPRAPPDQGDT